MSFNQLTWNEASGEQILTPHPQASSSYIYAHTERVISLALQVQNLRNQQTSGIRLK